MNVYEMYVANGKTTGFWVQRDSWGGTCAMILEIGPLKGRPPYYGNPTVLADVYDLNSGKVINSNVEISCPGTYTYRQIDPPVWCGEIILDHRAGKVLLDVPYEKKEQAKSIGAKWSPSLKSWWIPVEDDETVEKALERGFLSKRAYRKLKHLG